MTVFERPVVDRIVDVASVTLISAAAVLSAVCGYQSGRWGGERLRLYNEANAARVTSAVAADRAVALSAIDVNVFLQYVDAVDEGNARRAAFFFQRFRPPMRDATRAWLATHPLHNPHAPSSPFDMPQYKAGRGNAAAPYDDRAKRDFDAAQLGNRHADDFTLLTVVFASVSFLAGMSTKMSYPRHAIVVLVGIGALVYGIVRLAGLPFL